MNKIAFLLPVFLMMAASVQAETTRPEMADLMRSNGKIYVVFMVIATIFVGIVAFLIYLDRKISKIEKKC